jgi:hypothetical protein
MYLFALIMIVLNIAAFGPDFSFLSWTILREPRAPLELNSAETLPNSLVP